MKFCGKSVILSAAAYAAAESIMRLFEYKCPKCGKIFEEMVKNYNDEVKCPVCGEVAVKSYSGTMFTATGKQSGGCSGNCSACSHSCR